MYNARVISIALAIFPGCWSMPSHSSCAPCYAKPGTFYMAPIIPEDYSDECTIRNLVPDLMPVTVEHDTSCTYLEVVEESPNAGQGLIRSVTFFAGRDGPTEGMLYVMHADGSLDCMYDLMEVDP